MIRGIGTDLVEKERVKNLFLKYGDKFVNKLLAESEMKEFQRRKGQEKKVSFLSNNFASKEALAKALGTGFSLGIGFKNIEVLRRENGSPYLILSGKTAKKARLLKCQNFKLSIADTKEYSLAFVVGEEE